LLEPFLPLLQDAQQRRALGPGCLELGLQAANSVMVLGFEA
jgi:hypothetical protein